MHLYRSSTGILFFVTPQVSEEAPLQGDRASTSMVGLYK
jgi:hypothetical protein